MEKLPKKGDLFYCGMSTFVTLAVVSCGAPQPSNQASGTDNSILPNAENVLNSGELPAYDAFITKDDPSKTEQASNMLPPEEAESSTRSISIYNPNVVSNLVPTGGNLLDSFYTRTYSGSTPQMPDASLPPTTGSVSSYLYCYYNTVVTPKTSVSYNQIGGVWAVDPSSYSWYHPWYSWYVINGTRFIDGSVKVSTSAASLSNICKFTLANNSSVPKGAQFIYYTESAASGDFERPIWSGDVAPATRFRSIVAFGDSLSDIGNDYLRTTGSTAVSTKTVAVPNTPFWAGRFTSGFNWLDYLSVYLNISVFNWAYGGAESSNIVSNNLPMAVQDQITDYINKKGKGYTCAYAPVSGCLYGGYGDPSHTLYSILIGGNNYLDYTGTAASGELTYAYKTSTGSGPDQLEGAFITRTVLDVQNAIQSLVSSAGARYFIIPTLPDLSKIPMASNKDYNMPVAIKGRLSNITAAHNSQLLQMIQTLKDNYAVQGVNVTFITMDLGGILKQIMANPSSYGGYANFFAQMNGSSPVVTLANTSSACYQNMMLTSQVAASVNAMAGNLVNRLVIGGIIANNYMSNYETNEAANLLCANTESYVFFDNIHPTTTVHGLLAYGLQKYLRANYAR